MYAIYDDEAPVGFVMVAYFDDDDRDNNAVPYYFLWRLMIDEGHQNKGYGREVMKLIIDEVKTMPKGESNAFFTSTNGPAAMKLYESLGFVGTVERFGETELKFEL